MSRQILIKTGISPVCSDVRSRSNLHQVFGSLSECNKMRRLSGITVHLYTLLNEF